MHLLFPEQILKGGGCAEDHRSRKGQQTKGALGALDAHRGDKRPSAIAGVGGRDCLYHIVAHGTHFRLGERAPTACNIMRLNGNQDDKSRNFAEAGIVSMQWL
jgi:hypothetical protein